jgi:pimeloyl-ACP methyl ester carboxylesterase
VYAIQGMQDELVDPRTADYLEQRLQGRALKLWRRQTSGHFVLWQEQEAVVDVLRQLIADTAGG